MEEFTKPRVAVVVNWEADLENRGLLESLQKNELVGEVAVILPEEDLLAPGQHASLIASGSYSTDAVAQITGWFEKTDATHLLWIFSASVQIASPGLKRLTDAANDTQGAILYSDYLDQSGNSPPTLHPLTDYQRGSIRDDFDFGELVLISRKWLLGLLPHLSCTPDDATESKGSNESDASNRFESGGWYDLRLRLSEQAGVIRLCEPTYLVTRNERQAEGESHFRYVDPKNRDYQIEMEQIATAHLKRLGAYLDPPVGALVDDSENFPVEVSVIIPVRNRERTIADAVRSALSQKAPFDFNVLVVDNHSDDKTPQLLADLAHEDRRLVVMTPSRSDLGIGGCWKEAIDSEACGRLAVQLDSDDLYSGSDVLVKIQATFQKTGAAMVIGSYTIVDFDLNPIPPGLVDHREWTDTNGHNNALRIAGLGAPRAFHVPTLRAQGIPNVSYGEDYAIALRMTRTQKIGRIYESLYWCRRWEDNTDHALPLETRNRYAVYKDRLRTIELEARQRGSIHKG